LNRELKAVLHTQLYRHYSDAHERKARRIIDELFHAFRQDPRLLPPQLIRSESDAPRGGDYVAGMTDRYAIREYAAVCGGEN